MAQTQNRLDSSRMGEMPEAKLLLTMAVPMMLSMLVQALYNVVDSIYVSRVSEDCLSALSLAFPAQNIMIGIGTGTAVGMTTLISRALGRRDRDEASRVAGVGIFLSICCWIAMALFGIFAADPFIHTQTKVESIRAYADDYLRIVSIVSLPLYMQICVERLLQSTGRTRYSMWTQMIGSVTNIVLDPFFIFGWAGLPAMGTAGAAIATVIGQTAAATTGFILHKRRNKELPVHIRDIRPRGRIIGEIYRIGFPSILMMCINSVANYLMNMILGTFTSTAVAVYGAYFKLQSFFFMPVFGLNNGMVPIIGYNYGARKKRRIYNTIRWAVIYATILMALGFAAFQLIPKLLLGMFSPTEAMLEIGTHALRRISPSFLLAGFCIVAGSACQALNRSISSFVVSILRQVVALIPAAWLLSLTGDVNNVWWSFPIAELVSLVASFFFLRSAIRGVEQTLGDDPA